MVNKPDRIFQFPLTVFCILILFSCNTGVVQNTDSIPLQSSKKDTMSQSPIVLYQPDPVLEERVADIGELGTYIQKQTQLADTFIKQNCPDETVNFTIAIKPERRVRVWAEFSKADKADQHRDNLIAAMEAVPGPLVHKGPVAFAIQCGKPNPEIQLFKNNKPFMPASWNKAAADADTTLLVPDGILNVVWPE